MGKENIEKYSAGYAMLRLFAGMWHNKFFYRRVIVSGKENISPSDHLIYAPNHQNALMDALAVLFTSPAQGQPVFLARADIFKSRFIASLLYYLKILPVFRIRDGFESLRENDWVFKKTIDVIRNRNGLVILPEGNHAGQRRLRQLKKGICRIAFQAAQETDYSLKIKIVPVGLEFTHYTRVRQVLTVVYGKPIDVSEFYAAFRQNQQRTINDLRERLSLEMKNLMVHIESEDDYEALDELRSVINWRFSDDIVFPKLFRDRVLIDNLNKLKTTSEEKYRKICDLALKVKTASSRLKTDYRLLSRKKHTFFAMFAGIAGLTLMLPLFIYGYILNILFLAVPNLTIRNVKDVHFHSSIKYGISLLLGMLFLPVYLVLCLTIIKPFWLALAVFTTIPIAGLFSWWYWLILGRIIGGIRIRNYVKRKNIEFLNLRENFNELVKLVTPLA